MMRVQVALTESTKGVSVEDQAIPEYSFGDIRRHFLDWIDRLT